MALEQLSNLSASFLNADITSTSATSCTVLSGSWPTAGNFTIRVGSEIMLVTAISGSGPYTFTVARGQEGTTASTWTAGTYISETLTAASLLRVIAQADYPFPPVLANYTWNNQGSATITQSGNGLYLVIAPAGTESINALVKSIPTAPYTVTAKLRTFLPAQNFGSAGMLLRNSTSGKIITFASDSSSGFHIANNKYTNSTTFSATYGTSVNYNYIPEWFQIVDDSTNRKFQVSMDGITFTTIFSIGNTDFMTPDQIGFYGDNNNTGGATLSLLLKSWQEH